MRFVACCIIGLFAMRFVHASEFVVKQTGVEYKEDFNSFRGTFNSLPAGFAISLDSTNLLCITNVDFHGVSVGGVTAGGCYAWQLSGEDFALGYQPTADEFTPGFFLVVISNATALTVHDVSLGYEVVCLNNADRSTSLNLEISLDGVNYGNVAGMDFVSPLMQDKQPVWVRSSLFCRLKFVRPVAPGCCIWIRWYGDDAGGANSRDEYGIDNLRVTLHHVKGTVITVM